MTTNTIEFPRLRHPQPAGRGRVAMFLVSGCILAGLAGLAACESYDNGTTKSKSTRTEVTPTEKTTTTTTRERKVESVP